MKYLAVLGRLPEVSQAELEAQFGEGVKVIKSDKQTSLAFFEAPTTGEMGAPKIDKLGGTMKLGCSLEKLHPLDFLQNLPAGKITLGVSVYGGKRQVAQREGLKLKKNLLKLGRKVRLVPNQTAVLSTATSHHNKLGRKPLAVELLLFRDEYFLSLGSQNIVAYAKRDQSRPARDAKVGMLPPKLAQILLNLNGALPVGTRVLDPFCGTGVVLQEAAMMGYNPLGSDLNPRMVAYTKKNLEWLKQRYRLTNLDLCDIIEGDATLNVWSKPVEAVACETYLGPPMSQPPSEIKLKTVKQECKGIILGFLQNISRQIEASTPLTLAIPAWLRPDGSYSRLDILDEIEKMGYNVKKYSGADSLLYFREGQIVAREIISLRKN